MTTEPTTDLLAEVQGLIREREQEGVRGLADRIGPAEWADLVPQLEPDEVAVLLQWLPDDEIPELLEELSPGESRAHPANADSRARRDRARRHGSRRRR
jgi:Mg/Co/Ni transporter MgtE